MNFRKYLVLWLLLFVSIATAKDIRNVDVVDGIEIIETPTFMVTHEQPFYGLALIYNAVQPIYIIDNEVVFVDPEGTVIIPVEASHVGWKSRYQLALVSLDDTFVATFKNNKLELNSETAASLIKTVGYTDSLKAFSEVKYAHLWGWLRSIALGVEWLLTAIHGLVGHWGWSIVVLSVVMKLLLMPVGLMTLKFQRNVSKYQTLLAPRLAEIKQKYKSEKAHNEMMAAHKKLGISPFYTLKPLFSNFIQIPILVAIFNALGEMSVLEGQSFLWVNDLSLPDALMEFGFAIPLLGTSFNLLPFLMTLITLLSTVFYRNDLAPASETKKQKVNLYLMAFAFFVLFYPFPAAMVLYWAMANVLQFIQQKILGN